MSNDYKATTLNPLHLELMLQPPDEGATAVQDNQGCEVEIAPSCLEPLTSSMQPETNKNTE